MIYFTLPNFYLNYNLNQIFNKYIQENPNALKYPIKFQYMTGNFPFNIWNSNLNITVDRGAFYSDFQNVKEMNKNLPIRFNLSNVLADELDFYDAMTNTILDIFNTSEYCIEISNLSFMEYIQSKYPNYSFVFSKEANWMTDFEPELIDNIIEYNKFKLISLPSKFNTQLDLLKTFQYPEYLELTINPLCPFNCQFQESCAIQEHKMQLEYSEASQYKECTKRYNIFNTQLLTLDEIMNVYLPLGICHFTIDSWDNNYIQANYLEFYIKYFIKEEYQMDAYLEIVKELNNDKV